MWAAFKRPEAQGPRSRGRCRRQGLASSTATSNATFAFSAPIYAPTRINEPDSTGVRRFI